MGLLGRIAGRLFNRGAENVGAENIGGRKLGKKGRIALLLLFPCPFLAIYLGKITKKESNARKMMLAELQAQAEADRKKSPEQVANEAAKDVKADMGFEQSVTKQPVNEKQTISV